jgi:FkbM family methyltransferase
MYANRFLKKMFYSLGLDVKRYNPISKPDLQFIKMLKTFEIDTLFDIGANEGHFGIDVRENGYKGRIISFEPLTAAYKKLQQNAMRDTFWDIAPQMAIGNEIGKVEINVANNSESSSLLDMLEVHSNAASNSAYIDKEVVDINTLDAISSKYIDQSSKIFLKIDTQGYEDRVLNGAPELLKSTTGVQLELSLIPLYKDQLLYDEIIKKLEAIDFELWSINPVFTDPVTGRLLQVDATFFRNAY